jgi:hypothetical protein
MAGSTNRVEYYPSVGEPLPLAPTLVVTNGTGQTVTISDNPTWDPLVLAYVVAVAASEVPPSSVGETWTFVWTWTHEGSTLRDVEWGVVVSTGFEDLTPALRRKLRDTAKTNHEYFIGDGVSRDFNFLHYPVTIGTELIIVDGSQVPSSGYVMDYKQGILTFNSAPAIEHSIKASFNSTNYADSELEEHLRAAVANYNALMGTAYSTSNPVLPEHEKSIIIMLAVRDVYIDEMLSSAGSSILWRDEEKTIDKKGVTGSYKDAIGLLEERIRVALKERALASGGLARSGGAEPVKWSSIDWCCIDG